jgi:hypothetical protein
MEIVTTLYEGHYEKGVGALVNSLVQADFNGKICIGYRGTLPLWLGQLEKTDKGYKVSEDIHLVFIFLDVDMHFGYYKPSFMKKMVEEHPDVTNIYYFDPDIVVLAPWSFFKSWVKAGTALCLDNCYPFLHRNHPWRTEWKALAKNEQETDCVIDYYVNSGFIGINKANTLVIDKWIFLTEQYRNIGGDVSQFEKDAPRAFKGDQDLLNAALTICPESIVSAIGTEGMGFTAPAYVMAHAIDYIKPWKVNFVKEMIIKRDKPSSAAKFFFSYCEYPIRVFSKSTMILKRTNIKIADGIGLLLKK